MMEPLAIKSLIFLFVTLSTQELMVFVAEDESVKSSDWISSGKCWVIHLFRVNLELTKILFAAE